MKSYKVVYDSNGVARATVCSYTEKLANDLADEMEDKGVEVYDIVECEPGTPPEDIEREYN